MPEVRIQAELRTEFGKGAARATRRAGRVPAIIYGHGAETRHLSLPEHQLMLALKTPNALFRLEGLGVRAAARAAEGGPAGPAEGHHRAR